MVDNTAVTNGAGDVYRSVDTAGVKTDVVMLSVNAGGTEKLASPTNPLTATLVDSTGSALDAVVIGTDHYMGVAIVQDVNVSAGNSSVANLGAAASFTGTSSTTMGAAAIQVCLFADQNCTIQVQQAQEDPGTNWNIIDSWTYTASSTGNDAARTIQAVGSSFRVIVTNNGGSTTTALRLTSIFLAMADSLPRGLTQLGSLKTALQEAIPAGTNNIGLVSVKHAGSTGAQTSVAGTVTANTTLIAADATRVGLTIFNESTAILFVLYGAGTESATVYSIQVPAGGYLEVPDAFVTMRASGHWAAAVGSARITSAV